MCVYFYIYHYLPLHALYMDLPGSSKKQGNRLTRRPCKGDEFEILNFEAKGQNAGICGTCQKMFAIWTFLSIGRRVTHV